MMDETMEESDAIDQCIYLGWTPAPLPGLGRYWPVDDYGVLDAEVIDSVKEKENG